MVAPLLVERILRKLAHWNVSQAAPEEMMRPLGDPFRSLLASMYRGEPQVGDGGRRFDIDGHTRIAAREGMWLYDLCRSTQPRRTLEVGLAYGFSTLFFLAALKANGQGEHWAVDPAQSMLWKGVGAARASVVGMDESFHFEPEPSLQALSRFAREGLSFDVIFIDGAHLFDFALVDFVLASNVCAPSGYIVFDDVWLPAIRKVVSFIRTNRPDFTEAQTPVRRLWSQWSPHDPGNVVRNIALTNLALFQKTGKDARDWSHFVDFP